MSEHKACPFCGDTWLEEFLMDGDLLAALCGCGAAGPTVNMQNYDSEEEAEKAATGLWDQRAEAADGNRD